MGSGMVSSLLRGRVIDRVSAVPSGPRPNHWFGVGGSRVRASPVRAVLRGARSTSAPLAHFTTRYDLRRELHTTPTSQVWSAHDPGRQCEVAIKTVQPFLATPAAVERFAHEVDVTRSLRHPNVVPILEFGTWSGLPYYSMPYFRDGSVRDALEREGRLPRDRALRVVCDVASGVAHAHARGIVHRDIKPSNILANRDAAIIADFGIARSAGLEIDDDETCTTAGTPSYMSPEQITRGIASALSDIYSMGCLLFELLTGQRPFAAPTARETMLGHLRDDPPILSEIDPCLAPYDHVVQRAMAKEPDARFQHCGALIDALQGR